MSQPLPMAATSSLVATVEQREYDVREIPDGSTAHHYLTLMSHNKSLESGHVWATHCSRNWQSWLGIGPVLYRPMCRVSFALAAAVGLLIDATPVAASESANPLQFFEGRTESVGSVKVLFKNPTRTHSVGLGKIGPDGTLSLVQQVNDEGKPPYERRWHIRQSGPGRFTGTMSEATGPILIQQVGGSYRFRFKVRGLAVEQWLEPLPDGKSVRSTTSVRRLGIKVAAGQGIIRKTAAR